MVAFPSCSAGGRPHWSRSAESRSAPTPRAASFRRCSRVDGASGAGAGPRDGRRGLTRRQARLPVIMRCRVPDHHDKRPRLPAHPRSSRAPWAGSPTPHRPPRPPRPPPTTPDDLPALPTCLAQVPDPQWAQGRHHPLAFVLSLAACAVLAGAKSSTAIAKWHADAPPHVLARLGGPCREPHRGPVAPAEATVRRILQRIDGDALDTAVGSRLVERAAGQDVYAAIPLTLTRYHRTVRPHGAGPACMTSLHAGPLLLEVISTHGGAGTQFIVSTKFLAQGDKSSTESPFTLAE
ncbi:transposase family protein [Streptomyces sp. YIM B13518]|uniref:transposase family protein n=1 Tax=Streptomyces sp. YIM B13518 TaxID=3366316 RepID=UPI00367423C2